MSVDQMTTITVVRVDPRAAPPDDVRRARRRLLAAAVAALVGVVTLAWQLTAAESAGPSLEADAAIRDEVVIAGSDAVEVLNTLDHRHVASGLDAWASVTTGALVDQIAGIDRRQAAALARAGAESTARVVEAAVVSLDVAQGEASLIAFVEVSVDRAEGPDAVERQRYAVDLREVSGRWLVEALVPMELEP